MNLDDQGREVYRCATCGQPLAAWVQKHTIKDCRNWKAMRESERQEFERIVRAG